MILEKGDKILVVHRRLFERDSDRFFVGIVDGYEDGIARVSGYSWYKNQLGGVIMEKKEQRTKIFSLSSGTLIVYQLPSSVEMASLQLKLNPEGKLWLMDGTKFKMNLKEGLWA
jgi:hypothetical protein